jgi:hypothetical protein
MQAEKVIAKLSSIIQRPTLTDLLNEKLSNVSDCLSDSYICCVSVTILQVLHVLGALGAARVGAAEHSQDT